MKEDKKKPHQSSRRSEQFKVGPVRLMDWHGAWKAGADEAWPTRDEWRAAASSLYQWLENRYRVRRPIHPQIDCELAGILWYDQRTQDVIIDQSEILGLPFLHYIQEWLREGWDNWRVKVHTDGTLKRTIVVYPHAIRINRWAEEHLDEFLEQMREETRRQIEESDEFLRRAARRRKGHSA